MAARTGFKRKRGSKTFTPKKRARTFVPITSSVVRSYGNGAPMATRGYAFGSRERKVFDIGVASYDVNTTGTFTLISVPVPGTGFNNRIGRKIHNRSIYIRGRVALQSAMGPVAATQSSAQLLRMIVFCDLQPNGAAPAVTDLLVTASPASQLNMDGRDRFRILKDKIYAMDPYTAGAAYADAAWNRTMYTVKVYKKINIETIFNAGAAGTIADITSGAIYMFWIGEIAAGAFDSIASLSTRVRYDDS